MKIALATLNDSADIHQWSGLNYFIARSLEQAGATVHPVGPFATRWTTRMRLRQRWYDATGRTYHAIIEPTALDALGAAAREQIPRDADAVLAVTSLMGAALGPLSIPLASWDDATNAAMEAYYPDFQHLAPVSRKHSALLGQRAADAVTLAIYTSEWAADSAHSAYGMDRKRIAIVPFGANLEAPPERAVVEQWISARAVDRCHLLWIGVDWERKGGPLTLEITRELRDLGVDADLTIAGCTPPATLPEWARSEGFISKRAPGGEARLAALFARSHFFLMPSRAEAYGLVYAEAAACGVPSVAIRTGGVPAIIVDGATGILEDAPGSPAAFAARIAAHLRNRTRYVDMALAAFARSNDRLNWRVSGKRVVSLLTDLSIRAKTQ